MGAVADQQAADVVRLEEPLVRVERDRIGAIEVGHARGVAGRQSGGTSVRGVDVEPQVLGRGHVGQLADDVDRAGVGRPGHAGDRERDEARRPVGGDGGGDRRAAQPEPIVRREHDQRLGREAQQIEGASDGEMRLVGGVHPNAVEGRPTGRPAGAEQPAEVDVAGQGHAHEVGHHPARGQQPECVRTVPDEVGQPAHDLLLDERGERPGVPHVDALVGHLGEQLTHHRDGQRRRREVAELARVLRVHLAARQPVAELVQHAGDRAGGAGRRRRPAARAEERGADRGVRGRIAHRAHGRLVVQEVEGGGPRVGAEPLHRRARSGGVAVADQLRFGMPGEAVGRVGHGRRW